jgi:hypothetical protein
VQPLPSSQVVLVFFGACKQPVTGSMPSPSSGWQLSVVHGLSSEQFLGSPVQVSPWQISFSTQRLPVLHGC